MNICFDFSMDTHTNMYLLLDNRPRGYKTLFMLNSTENFNCSYKLRYQQIKMFLALSLSDVAFNMLLNVQMPTIVGILTFMSRINFVLS